MFKIPKNNTSSLWLQNILVAGAHPEGTSGNCGLVSLGKCRTGSEIVSLQENDGTSDQDEKNPENRMLMIKLHEIS